VIIDVVVVVQLLGVLSGLTLDTLPIIIILALGLDELVDLGTGEACNKLLGELMGDGLAWAEAGQLRGCCKTAARLTLITLVVLEGFEAGKGGSTGNGLMREAGRVVGLPLVVVDRIVGVVRFT
jgi:hypothetical protein